MRASLRSASERIRHGFATDRVRRDGGEERVARRRVDAAVGLERDRHRLSGLDLAREQRRRPAARRGRHAAGRRSRRPRSRSPCPPAPAPASARRVRPRRSGVTTRLASPSAVRNARAFGSLEHGELRCSRRRGRARARAAQTPSATAATAATAAADDEDRHGDTTARAARRSAARCAPARGSGRRSDAGGVGPPAARASAPATCQKPCSSSRQRSHEARCSS